MRIDLTYDFLQHLQLFFQGLLNQVDAKTYDLQNSFIRQRGNSIFKSFFYFCCCKGYYSLTKSLYTPYTTGGLVLKRHNVRWRSVGKTERGSFTNKEITVVKQKLTMRCLSRNEFFKKTIEVHAHSGNHLIFFAGFCINEDHHQTFYLWKIKLKHALFKNYPEGVQPQHKKYMLGRYEEYRQYIVHPENQFQNKSISAFLKSKHLNRKTFQRDFKSVFCISFYEYHVQCRLLQALYLLLFTEKPVSTIAYECGYESYRVFYHAFCKNQPYSPSQFRHLMR